MKMMSSCFLNDATKQGYTNAEGLPIFLKMEYPTLKNSDIKKIYAFLV